MKLPFSGKIKSILIPRFDTIGDLVLLEPFLRALSRVFKKAQITLLVREPYDQLASLFPPQLQWQTIGLNPYSHPIDPPAVKDLLGRIENSPWDLILFTKYEPTWLDYLIGGRLKGVRRLALSPGREFPNWFMPYLRPLDIDSEYPWDEPVVVEEKAHESEKYRVLLSHLAGRTKRLPPPKLTVPEPLKNEALEIMRSLGLPPMTFCVCLPGGTENITIKRWPLENFAKAIRWLKSRYQINTLLIGHEKEGRIVTEAADLAGTGKDRPPVWLGKDRDIPLLAGILEKAKFYLGNDSGPMHLSGALGIPVVALFGGGTWPRFIPKGLENHVVVRPMPCFSCDWKCSFGDAPCIKDLPLSLVQKAIESVVSKNGPGKDEIFIHEAKSYPKIAAGFIQKAGETFRKNERDREARLRAIRDCERQLQEIDQDRKERLKVIMDLGQRLQESEADRADRLEEIRNSERRMQEMEKNREARLREMEDLGRRLEERERERAAFLAKIKDLEKRLEESEKDRADRLDAIRSCERQIQGIEADRKARLQLIHNCERQMKEMEEDREARLRYINALGRQMETMEAQNAALVKEVESLKRRLEESETDRAARLEAIRNAERRMNEIEEDREARLRHINDLGRQMEIMEAEKAALLKEVESLKRYLKEKEDDQTVWIAVIRNFERRMKDIEEDREAQGGQIEMLSRHLKESEADRAARLQGIKDCERKIVDLEADRAARLQFIHKQMKIIEIQKADVIKSSLMGKRRKSSKELSGG
jgi:ADP-heptose:LPS heptosyltransferase